MCAVLLLHRVVLPSPQLQPNVAEAHLVDILPTSSTRACKGVLYIICTHVQQRSAQLQFVLCAWGFQTKQAHSVTWGMQLTDMAHLLCGRCELCSQGRYW